MSKQYSDSIALAARQIVAASAVDVTTQVHILPLAKTLMAETGCSIDTAKRHIAKAVRLARGELTTSPTWGGKRTPAGGRPRKMMNVDQLTHYLAFERANHYVGCAPVGAWAADPGKNDETPDGPRWHAKLNKPLASVCTSTHLVRRLYIDTGPGAYYVEALSGDGTFWAKVPASLVEEVKDVFDV